MILKCANHTVYHIPEPLTPQSKGTGWPQTELTMNGLEKSPGDLDIAYRDIYECLTGNRGRGGLWRSETLCLAWLGDTAFIFSSVIVPGLNISCLKPQTN